MLKEDIYTGIENNIKIGKLQLIKGLWMAKFSYENSNDTLLDANHSFEESYGTMDNYFSSNCQLEIGSNYLRENDSQTANAFIFRSFEILTKIFTPDHPLMQKYYSYAAEVASHVEDNDMVLSLAR